jgi:DNA (cytosine-5)-methyltransferase 1
MRKLNFIDLFAGLGGFHLALSDLGHKCVFASELNQALRDLYEKNHKTNIQGDINQVDINSIPSHDILCAGFPCQPFSQAGARLGLDDPRNGNLFYRIMEILYAHEPEFVFLENVPNLKGHDDGNTWKVIHKELSKLYDVRERKFCHHINFGIPQHRSRIYIVGRLKKQGGLKDFEFPEKDVNENVSIHDIIIKDDTDFMTLREDTKNHLEVWQEFLDHLQPSGSSAFSNLGNGIWCRLSV